MHPGSGMPPRITAPDRPPTHATRNRLLAALPADELTRLGPRLEPVSVRFGELFWDVGQPIDHVWFPEGLIVSVLGVVRDGSAVETATIGIEGSSGIPLFLGDDRTGSHAYCQVPGDALRMTAADFRAELARGGGLADVMRRYTHAYITFTAQSSACNRLHTMRERCARWLLHTHDRVGRDEFPLTHQVLSQMLGVRRATVTEAMIVLQGLGAIAYEMGRIVVRDRAALERAACECYEVIQREHDRLLARGAPGGAAAVLGGGRASDDGMSTVGDGAPRRGHEDG